MFCQLEMLRHCLAPSLRRQLNELPRSLDETYERVLKEIESTNQGRHARRLLHCLAVAIRPLHVMELAEVLTFDLDTFEGEIPRFHPEWRWENQEQAVLSACSSLVTIDSSRVIQFSHFSVKEYLTSDRLATASRDVSRYHIVSEHAHLILARACLGVLLNLDNCINKEIDETSDEGSHKNGGKDIPLLEYAAEHWALHAQVENVSSQLKDTMATLFDLSRPFFLAWLRVHDIAYISKNYRDKHGWFKPKPKPKPLYYAAYFGFYDLVQHLIVKHPDHVNDHRGDHGSPLVAALSGNFLRVVELLLEHGAHVHVRGDPPLFHVISFSDDARVASVQLLLRHCAYVNAGQENFQTPLHRAADVGCAKVARILLEHGADVDHRDDMGQVPLHLVSNKIGKHDHERSIVAQLLLENHADVNALDEDHLTPLHFASSYGRLEVARLLLDHGAKANARNVSGQTALHLVSQREDFSCENPNIARLFLEFALDVNAKDKDDATPLHFACSHGNFETALVLLEHGANVNAQNADGQTPLHRSSQCSIYHYEDDSPRIVQLMLEHGADVNARDKDQETPLHLASYQSKWKTVLALLDHGAEVDARNADGQTPLHQAPHRSASLGDTYSPVTQVLLGNGADLNAQDNDQDTPLHSACFHGCFATALALLDHGAERSAPNAYGQTPLHRASQSLVCHENARVAQLLLERGVDVNARDNDQATPLHFACYNSSLEIVQVLLDHGAEADARDVDGRTPLHKVSQDLDIYLDEDSYHGPSIIARLLLEPGVDVNARDEDQATPLHIASNWGLADLVEVLLDHGARADAEDIWGNTPLHQVVIGDYQRQGFGLGPWQTERHRTGILYLSQHLLERGADVNAQNEDQETPLHLASRLRLHELARFLLKHGADVDVENVEGKSPLQLASRRKGKAMRRLLSEYSAKIA